MGRKKNQAPGLGKSLIKDRFGKKSVAHLHAVELAAEHQDDDINLKSVTELNSLDDFLATAELAGTEFTAQKLNVHFVSSNEKGILTKSEQEKISLAQNEYKHLLQIPRRPKWDETTSKEELQNNERASFLSWRRQLAVLQEESELITTPYEKNLDFWRQLWRVIERSDVVVQIVDARDPLLFRCADLEAYVKEVDPAKKNMILVNKADLLSSEQRRAWKEHLQSLNVEAVFWSAVLENDKLDDDDEEEAADVETKTEENLLSREELIAFFKNLVPGKKNKVIGMVGYPNVGKSSTVNTLIGVKRVAVSATPGRTKHFQTLHVDHELCLCDCPGLVFPSFVSNKSEMILNGILPIDQMRDHVAPVNLLSRRIPRQVIEVTYGANIARPPEGEDPDRPPTSSEILNAHALLRGFMTAHGQPDNARSARIILKDYVNGKLLCSKAPPGVDEDMYRRWTISKVDVVLNSLASSLSISDDMKPVISRINRLNKNNAEEQASEVEKEFFGSETVRTFVGGKKQTNDDGGQKGNKKHFNKRKEKMRRIRTVQY